MLIEAITISSIVGANALVVWFAIARFQPEIERSLAKVEAATATTEQETIAARHRSSNKTNKTN
jgi:lipocalin